MSGFTRNASLALVVLALVGCGKHPQSSFANPIAKAAQEASYAAVPALPASAARHTFARMPDRGELVAYPGNVVRQDGAYTWHRTDLSEAHALNAIADGHLRVTTPSGQLLDFKYDNHVEHPSGDWTWVGHIADHPEQQTVITFGEHAAFGSIAQPGQLPLRLTVRNGAGWLVETDPHKVAGIINSETRPRREDFLIPPKAAIPSMSARTSAVLPVSMASAPNTALASTAVSATIVDLVIGYTPAFASDNGGTSGAVTHLNYLVDVANVAYTNSQISAKVRLVATVPVTYPDNTSNDSALTQLTGYDKNTNARITPDPAFNALRAAREQYGADMVSLVRSFREPTNGGCGIAWLIGGGRQPFVQSDSEFAYSVVSDGTSQGTDGHSYYCLDETLAHELGHGMGAAHDIDTVKKANNGVLDNNGYGAFAYSFGYKSTAGGFYTVMAYGDKSQTIYRTFSNPRSTFCGGSSCGIDGQADNALTLAQTIPIVATFRSSVVGGTTAVRTDINGDGRSDFLWRHNANEWLAAWMMDGPALVSSIIKPMSISFTVVANGDFNGDGKSDLIWSDSARNLYLWTSDGNGGFTQAYMGAYGEGWQILGAYDLDGDGRAELVMQNRAMGWGAYWKLNGSAYISSTIFNIPSNYTLVGFGDFNADGLGDMAFRDPSQTLYAWIGTKSGGFTTQLLGAPGPGWVAAGVGDFDGDGMADVVWRNAANSWIAVWLLDHGQYRSSTIFHMDNVFQLTAIADYNGDGKSDIVWIEPKSRSLYQWLSTGTGFTQNYIGQYGEGWQMLKTNVDPGM
jgi:hypothetical protein